MTDRCTCDPISQDDMCPVHASGGYVDRIAALEAENERLRTAPDLRVFLQFVAHLPSCAFSGRDWPVECTCGLTPLREIAKRAGLDTPTPHGEPR